ncbi:MAG: helix-turn-helix transcriptional regulator [Chloroflexi bacterium]|nr:helix-turn-helix transcriptional regulator [Chloroflexota bacterium]
MSPKQIAKELGISPAYLSYMLNGKRPWRKDLYQRYMGGVNTFVNNEAESVNKVGSAIVAAGAFFGAEDEI